MVGGMFTGLNKEVTGLTPAEEKAIVKAFPYHTPDAERELIRYFSKVKRATQVFAWVIRGDAKIENFSSDYSFIELKTKDGQSHRVELF